jgi:hypothetical protein
MFMSDLLSILIQKAIQISFDINPQRHTTIQTVVFCCGKKHNNRCALNGKIVALGFVRQN